MPTRESPSLVLTRKRAYEEREKERIRLRPGRGVRPNVPGLIGERREALRMPPVKGEQGRRDT